MLFKDEVHKAISAIAMMEVWSNTPQGNAYWQTVVDNLNELRDTDTTTELTTGD